MAETDAAPAAPTVARAAQAVTRLPGLWAPECRKLIAFHYEPCLMSRHSVIFR
jgi:hypothetical protein